MNRFFEWLLGIKGTYVVRGDQSYNFHVYLKGKCVAKTKTFQEAINACHIIS